MAVITKFELTDGTRLKRHRTEVPAKVFVFGEGRNGPIVQINTYGSADRETEGVSQTMQFERKSAEDLWKLLGQTYGFK
ncbi:hypothetical protein [Phenylobacterium sp.]|uniref:hypothetical protein n=1 Tax=Phenylobacterium sp. TaxID=1871053 RepID=UPI0025F410C8|nr:hypothetical protein [Phenylobacterium sp.]